MRKGTIERFLENAESIPTRASSLHIDKVESS
jgi:hypothetical protein